jgi:hypothetical protein
LYVEADNVDAATDTLTAGLSVLRNIIA